jgi:hypothetical protein
VRDSRCRVPCLPLICALAVALGSPPERASATAAEGGCIALAGTDPLDLLTEQPPRGGRPGSEPRGPITDAELDLLMNALERVPLKEGGWTIRGVTEGTKLPVERLQRLVGDVRAVLAEVNGRELLDRLRRMPGMERGDLRAFEGQFTEIARCTVDRFQNQAAYRQTQQLVLKQRSKLASLVLEPLDRPAAPAKDER